MTIVILASAIPAAIIFAAIIGLAVWSIQTSRPLPDFRFAHANPFPERVKSSAGRSPAVVTAAVPYSSS